MNAIQSLIFRLIAHQSYMTALDGPSTLAVTATYFKPECYGECIASVVSFSECLLLDLYFLCIVRSL